MSAARLALAALLLTTAAACKKKATKPVPPPAVAALPAATQEVIKLFAAIPWRDAQLDWSRPPALDPSGKGFAQAGYVGSHACQACHAAEFSSFARHSMAKSGLRDLASLDAPWLAKAFDEGVVIQQTASGYAYRPYREGGAFFVEEVLDMPDGTRLHSWKQPITLGLSAGSYGMAFGFRYGDRAWQVPIDYNPKLDHWGLDPGYLEKNPRFSRAFTGFCISCHADYPVHLAGSLDAFAAPLPTGIGCERCHGPGARHLQTTKAADIVNPAKLPAARQLDICAQCHLEGKMVERAGRDVFGFRPGEPLTAFRMNWLEDPAPPGEFRLLSHSERLVRSACYRGAQGKMTCTSCHDPHVSALEEPPEYWDQRCLASCHKKESCTGDPAARAQAKDHCVGCHMRTATPADTKLLVMTDHWIQRRPAPAGPPDAPTQRERGYVVKGLVSYATLTGDKPTGADLATAEGVAYAELGQFDEGAKKMALGIVSFPDVPKAYLLLAQAFESLQQPWNSARTYEALLHLEPDYRPALLGYSRILFASGPPGSEQDAMAALDRQLAMAPDDPDANEAKGVWLTQHARGDEAKPLFTRAAQASPVTGRARVGLAAAALKAGDLDGAVTWLEEARRIEPFDGWVLDKLRDSYGKLGQIAARKQIETVLAKAPREQLKAIASAWLPPELR